MDLTTADRIRKLKLAGIGTVPSSRRIYPEGKLAAQVIGTVGVDDQGLTGLEAADDSLLGAANGERQVVLDGLGKEIERNTVNGAQQGQDLRLTLDAGIQARTEEVLANLAQTYQPEERHGDRHGPAQCRGPGDGRLAQLRSEQAGLRLSRGAAEHGHRVHI